VEVTVMKNKIEFWAYLLDRLNTKTGIYAIIPGVLQELCDYLNFGCGFFYEADHNALLLLKHCHTIYEDNHLPPELSLADALGSELLTELKNQPSVSFRAATCDTPLKQQFAELLQMKSMVLVPITDQDQKLVFLIGIADRRGTARFQEDDQTLTVSLLRTLAATIQRQMYQDQVIAARRALSGIMDNMGVDIYVNDFYTHEILYANKSMAAPYGGVDNMIGKTCWKVLYNNQGQECEYCPQNKIIDENGEPTKLYSWDYQRPFDGSWYRVLSAAFEWIDGRLAHIVSSVDITENKRNEALIQRMAEYDSLTSLPNRYRMTKEMDHMMPIMAENKTDGYIIFFDLDGFKDVNDRLGHIVGDELLTAIGKALESNPYTKNYSYRFGGDEFIILCYGDRVGKLPDILRFLEKGFSIPHPEGSGEVHCFFSIGISHCPYDDDKTSGLIRKADIAMYASKGNSKVKTHFYNQGFPCPAEEYNP